MQHTGAIIVASRRCPGSRGAHAGNEKSEAYAYVNCWSGVLAETWAFAAAQASVDASCYYSSSADAAAKIRAKVGALEYSYEYCYEDTYKKGTSGTTTDGDADTYVVRPLARHVSAEFNLPWSKGSLSATLPVRGRCCVLPNGGAALRGFSGRALQLALPCVRAFRYLRILPRTHAGRQSRCRAVLDAVGSREPRAAPWGGSSCEGLCHLLMCADEASSCPHPGRAQGNVEAPRLAAASRRSGHLIQGGAVVARSQTEGIRNKNYAVLFIAVWMACRACLPWQWPA